MAKKSVPTDAEIMSFQNVPVRIAAAYLDLDAETVRKSLKQGRAPYGHAVQCENGGKWTFHISPGMLVNYQCGRMRSLAESAFVKEVAAEVESILELRSRAAMAILAPGMTQR